MRAPVALPLSIGARRRRSALRADLAPRWLALSFILGALLPTLLPLPAAAEETASKPALVFLPVEGETASPQLDAELLAALEATGKTVQLSSLRLDDLMLGVGCDTASVACLQKIGTTVAAEGLILSTLRPSTEGPELSVRWFDVATGGDQAQAKIVVPADEAARRQALGQAARQLFGLAEAPASTPAPEEQGGTLSISASVPYVEVILEGQPRGALPLELRELPPGTYSVVGRREGYLTWRGSAEVKPGQKTYLELEMVAAPEARPAAGYLDSIRTPTWVIAGVGLASLVGGAACAAVLQTEQNTFDETRGVTLAEIDELKDLRDAGERNALTANILFGIGGAALLTAAVLSYFDYSRQGRLERQTSASPLSVGPGSIQLQLSY